MAKLEQKPNKVQLMLEEVQIFSACHVIFQLSKKTLHLLKEYRTRIPANRKVLYLQYAKGSDIRQKAHNN